MGTSPNSAIKGFWQVQYAPRDRVIRANLNKPTLAKWNKKSMIQKMVIIDKFQAKGMFEKRH